jgi:hypothetical protein
MIAQVVYEGSQRKMQVHVPAKLHQGCPGLVSYRLSKTVVMRISLARTASKNSSGFHRTMLASVIRCLKENASPRALNLAHDRALNALVAGSTWIVY